MSRTPAFTIRLSPQDKKRLQAIANKNNLTMSAVVKLMIEDLWKNPEQFEFYPAKVQRAKFV